MLKHLLAVFTLLITLSLTAQPVLASIAPTAPQTPNTQKKYYELWQKMTLTSILRRQVSVSATPQSATPTPTPPKTVTNSAATPTPTTKPITLTPTTKPSSSPVSPASTNDVTTSIVNEINTYRTSLGLSTVTTSAETCNFAKTRAQEITTSFNHDGFTSRQNAHTLPYASWTAITENIAMTSDYKQVEKMWQNSAGHAANMRANTPFVCVMQSGNYFAYEGMKP